MMESVNNEQQVHLMPKLIDEGKLKYLEYLEDSEAIPWLT